MGSRLVGFSVQAFPGARVLGKSVRVKVDVGLHDHTVQDLWESMAKDGSLDSLLALPERLAQTPDTVGWMGGFQPGDEAYTYVAGVLAQPNTTVPDGFVCRGIAPCTMAIGWIQGTECNEGGDMMANASEHVTRAMEGNGYEYDGSNGFFEIEYYSYERFRGPVECGEKPILDFCSPCKKAN